MTPLKILIADDHTLVRQGLRRILEGQEGWEVVAETGDGALWIAARDVRVTVAGCAA
jgi:DNA-binding NarL/FixJ family response regulator